MRLWPEIIGLMAAWSAVLYLAMLGYVRLLRAIKKLDSALLSWLLGLPLYLAMGVVITAGVAGPALLAQKPDSELEFWLGLGLYVLGCVPAAVYWSRNGVRL